MANRYQLPANIGLTQLPQPKFGLFQSALFQRQQQQQHQQQQQQPEQQQQQSKPIT